MERNRIAWVGDGRRGGNTGYADGPKLSSLRGHPLQGGIGSQGGGVGEIVVSRDEEGECSVPMAAGDRLENSLAQRTSSSSLLMLVDSLGTKNFDREV